MRKLPAVMLLLFGALIDPAGVYARGPRPLAIIPGISAGYIFGAGISFGAELNYAPIVFDMSPGRTATGIYASFNYFHSKGEIYASTWYRTVSFGALAYSDARLMFKAGASKTLLRWGSENRNKTRSKKWTPEIDLSYDPTQKGTFFGYRLFFPGNACFGLDISTANLLYGAYRYNVDRNLFGDAAD
ncbi:MAG: hypothetical protein FD123_2639 [Bacteroidetes bacterium]|nr:MAG: hypothetical protein FD123_2639 [Bacteroidota bacterium]